MLKPTHPPVPRAQLLLTKALKPQSPGHITQHSPPSLHSGTAGAPPGNHSLPKPGAMNRHKHSVLSLTLPAHHIPKHTFAHTLHFYFFLCSPNSLTIFILSTGENQRVFNWQFCLDLKGFSSMGMAHQRYRHVGCPGNWDWVARHHKLPLGMVTQALTLVWDTWGVGGAVLPLSELKAQRKHCQSTL